MSDPWDIPSFPDQGDGDEDITYSAVGRTLSSWEFTELEFAELYAVLTGNLTYQAILDYGARPVFRERIDGLCRAAKAHFIRYPGNQPVEAEFDDLLRHARGWGQ